MLSVECFALGVLATCYWQLAGSDPAPTLPRSEALRSLDMMPECDSSGVAGDTWPSTWAADGELYASGGDNHGSHMNFWRVRGDPRAGSLAPSLTNSKPVDWQARRHLAFLRTPHLRVSETPDCPLGGCPLTV